MFSLSALKKVFRQAIHVLQVKKVDMEVVAHDPSATKVGIFIFIFPFVFNYLLTVLRFGGFSRFFLELLLSSLVLGVLFIFVVSFVATQFFHGKGSHLGFFRVMTYASLIQWLSIVPFVFLLFNLTRLSSLNNVLMLVAGIWMLAVAFHALLYVHQIKQRDALIVLIIAIVLSMVVQNLGIFSNQTSFGGPGTLF